MNALLYSLGEAVLQKSRGRTLFSFSGMEVHCRQVENVSMNILVQRLLWSSTANHAIIPSQ